MTHGVLPSDARWRNYYGRRHGKTLRKSQRESLSSDLAALSPGPVDRDLNPGRVPLDMARRFHGRPVWLDIGFGGGEHMVHQAAANPDTEIIGCEPFINGVAMLLIKVRQARLHNITVYPGDVRDLFDVLPKASVDRAFLLYPEPWPKLRHHRRRFVTPEYLQPLARVLRPGALFRVATDIPDFVRQTLEQVPGHGFAWLTECAADWRKPWDGWLATRWEKKALRAGRVPYYLTFARR